MKKLPLREFVLDDSEDYDSGLSLIMKVRDNVKSKIPQFDCHILIWEVGQDEYWAIIEASDINRDTHKMSELNESQRRMAISTLMNHGIHDDTEI